MLPGHSDYEHDDEVETRETRQIQWETKPDPGWEYYYGEILA